MYIGSTYPAGAASAATVSLTQNQSAFFVYLGYGAGTAGTLQLGNSTLTAYQLVLGGQSAGTAGTATVLRGTGTLNITDTLTVSGSNSFTFAAGDVATYLTLTNGGQATTAATGNVSKAVSVSGTGSKLTLGADLSVGFPYSIDLYGGGTLDAQGHKISVGGNLVLEASGASLLNRGGLTVGGTLSVTGQPFALTAADSVSGFSLSGAAATTTLGAGVAVGSLSLDSGATASTTAASNVTGSISVDGAGSKLTLGADLTVGTFNTIALSGGGTLDAQGHSITGGGYSRLSLDATSSLLNRGPLTIGANGTLSVTGQPFALTAADAVAGTFALSGAAATTTLGAGVAVGSLSLDSGATASTTAAGNVTGSVSVAGAGSKLTLGADLTVGTFNSIQVSGGGVLDAQGRKISGGQYSQLSLDATGSLLNRGPLTIGANGTLAVTGQPFALTAADAVAGTFALSGAAATTTLGAGVAVGTLSLSGGATASTTAASNVTGSISVDGAGSKLTLGADLYLSALYVNQISGGGVLDAQGHKITTVANSTLSLDATGSLVNRGALTLGTLAVAGQPFALTAADQLNSLSLSGGATASTATVGNVTGSVSVTGSTLTLGANLQLSSNFAVTSGTVNAQGRNLAALGVSLTAASGGGAAPVLQNLGTVTATTYTQAGGSSVTLGAGDSTVGSLTLSQNSTLAVKLLTGAAGRLTVTGTAASALSIESGSHLALTLDGTQPGYALRWANPGGGDHVADLNALIASGAISISLTNSAMYAVNSDGTYSYVFQPVPEPAHLMLAAGGALGLVQAVRRGRRGG